MLSSSTRLSGPALASLIALTLNVTVATIVIHISRVRLQPGQARYKASSAIVLTEVGKLLISVVLAWREVDRLREHPGLSPAQVTIPLAEIENADGDVEGDAKLGESEKTGFLANERSPTSPVHSSDALADRCQAFGRALVGGDCWKVAIPAGMFTIQGNLAFVAVANLSVPAFQVASQLKILTTALCAVVMLHRRLTVRQWASLCTLGLGVAMVQLSAATDGGDHSGHSGDDRAKLNPWLGFGAVVAVSISSGYASTYFEKQLKRPARAFVGEGMMAAAAPVPETGLWVRNVQLSTFALLMGFLLNALEANQDALLGLVFGPVEVPLGDVAPVAVASWSVTRTVGNFFDGFSGIVWFIVFLQIGGGVLAALVIKHADNVLKTIATSLAIVLSFAASVVMFDYHLSLAAVFGASLVIAAAAVYAAPS